MSLEAMHFLITEFWYNSDMLNRLETKSSVYSHYRSLIDQNPKGVIKVQFTIGRSLKNFEIEYDLKGEVRRFFFIGSKFLLAPN